MQQEPVRGFDKKTARRIFVVVDKTEKQLAGPDEDDNWLEAMLTFAFATPDQFSVGSDEDECFCDCDHCCDSYILKVMRLLQLQSVVTVTITKCCDCYNYKVL